MPSVLVLVENNSVPTDIRVWSVCRSLRSQGWDVAVVSPRRHDRDVEPFAVLDGISIYRFSLAESSGGALGYLREYGAALTRMNALVRRLSKSAEFDIVHACNPPDVLLLTALGLRRRGAATVFDHHDLSPELYAARGGSVVVGGALAVAERVGFALADVVLATNESFREIAITRGRKSAEDVFVVRNGPDLVEFQGSGEDGEVVRVAPHVIGYVGAMGLQDGIDVAVDALRDLNAQRTDWQAVFVGDGEALPTARSRCVDLGMDDRVSFLGFVSDRRRLARLISSFDLCLSPEPRNPLNEHSTLIKVAEYMAAGRPVVAFDLTETRRTAGPAASYAVDDSPAAFAQAMSALLDDPGRRAEMGDAGRERIRASLSWSHSEEALLAAYDRARALSRRRR